MTQPSDTEGAPAPHLVTEGDWAGWSRWSDDPFETRVGPFYSRRRDDGSVVCAFIAEARHMNAGGFMHGGCLMSFADFALFCIGAEAIRGGHAVTASMNSDFVDAARIGERIEATGEVIRGGRSLVFIRGLVSAEGRSVMSFSGVLKKIGAAAGRG